MRRVLIIGATSAIAEACSRLWAERGDRLFLAGRNEARLTAIADDLRVRGAAGVDTATVNVDDIDMHAAVIAAAHDMMGGLDIALIAHGVLPDQERCNQDTGLTLRAFHTNATATIALMHRLALRFEAQGAGVLAVISSIAGDRGRAMNTVYGAAKSAITTYASALRQRLWRCGVHVLTIKPGFVDTPMTAGMRRNALFSTPHTVAWGIVRAIDRRRNVVYLPWFWRPVMAVIRLIPEVLFRRMRF